MHSLLATPFPMFFRFDPDIGFSVDDAGNWLCPACLAEERIVRLVQLDAHTGMCNRCRHNHYGHSRDA